MSVSHAADSFLESRLLARLKDKDADPFAFLTKLSTNKDFQQSSEILVISDSTSKTSQEHEQLEISLTEGTLLTQELSELSPEQQLVQCMANLRKLAPLYYQQIKPFIDKLLDRSEITLQHIHELNIMIGIAKDPMAQRCLNLYVDGKVTELSNDEDLLPHLKIQKNFLKAQNKLIDAIVYANQSEDSSKLGQRIFSFLDWLYSLEPSSRKKIKHFIALLPLERIIENFQELEALINVAKISKKIMEYIDYSQNSEEIDQEKISEKARHEEFLVHYVSGKISALKPLSKKASAEKQAEQAFLKVQSKFIDALIKRSFSQESFEAACAILTQVRKEIYHRKQNRNVFRATPQRCHDLTVYLDQVVDLIANDNPTVGEVNHCIDSANVVSHNGQKLDKAFILVGAFITAASTLSGLWLGIPLGMMIVGAAGLSHKTATQQRQKNKEEVSCLAERPLTIQQEKSTESNKIFDKKEIIQEKPEVQEQCIKQLESSHAEKQEEQKEPSDENSENIIVPNAQIIKSNSSEEKNKLIKEMNRLKDSKDPSELALAERISTFLQWLPSLPLFYQGEMNRFIARLTLEQVIQYFDQLEELMQVAKISKEVTEEGSYKLISFYMRGIIAELEPLPKNASIEEQAEQDFCKAQREFISAMVTLSKRSSSSDHEQLMMTAYSMLSEVRSYRYAKTTEIDSQGKEKQVNVLLCGPKESKKLTSHLSLVAGLIEKTVPTLNDIDSCVKSANEISCWSRKVPAAVITFSVVLIIASIPFGGVGPALVVAIPLLTFAGLSLKGITKRHEINQEKMDSLAKRPTDLNAIDNTTKQQENNKIEMDRVTKKIGIPADIVTTQSNLFPDRTDRALMSGCQRDFPAAGIACRP